MAELATYATAHTIVLPLYEPGSNSLALSKAFAAGDVTVSKDDGATYANIATLPSGTTANGDVALAFSAAELTCKRLRVKVADLTTPKEFDDDNFVVETFGNALAQHPMIGDTSGIAAATAAALGGATIVPRSPVQGTNLEIFRADAYNTLDGTSRRITFTKVASEVHWPDTLDSVFLTIKPTAAAIARGEATVLNAIGPIAGVITVASGDARSFYFELTSAQTDDLIDGNGNEYWVRANTADYPATLRSGTCMVRPDPTA